MDDISDQFQQYLKFLAVVVLALAVVLGFYKYSNNEDFLINLVSEFLGIFIGVLFLNQILEYPETSKWNAVKAEVMSNFKRELKGIFIDLKIYTDNMSGKVGVDPSESIGKVLTEIDKDNLENLSKSVKIREFYKKFLLRTDNIFLIRADNLSEIESKYFKFLNPSVVLSIIRIQNILRRINMQIKIKNIDDSKQHKYIKWFKTDDEFYTLISVEFREIFKELHKLYIVDRVNFLERVEL